MNCLIVLIINLGGMLAIYSLLAFALVRCNWHGRGIMAVLVTILAANLSWIAPTLIGSHSSIVEAPISNSLSFGNWLVSAFAVVLFFRAAKGIPRQLEDAARLDGCTWLGIYWHVVLPLVRRELGVIALVLVMATALPLWANLTNPGVTDIRPFFELVRAATFGPVGATLVVSVIASLPVIAILLVAKATPRSGC